MKKSILEKTKSILAETSKRAKCRKLDDSDILAAIEVAKSEMKKSIWQNETVIVSLVYTLPNCYKWRAESDFFTIRIDRENGKLKPFRSWAGRGYAVKKAYGGGLQTTVRSTGK